MKSLIQFAKSTLIGGALVVLPAYLAVVLLGHLFAQILALVHPISSQLPEVVQYPQAIVCLALIAGCFLAGIAVRTAIGHQARALLDRHIFERIPGYTLLRGMVQQIADTERGEGFIPALAEMEDGLVPAFIVERHGTDRCTIFVPSSPTPASGSIYILPAARVHLLDVSLMKAMGCITKWGAGSSVLLAAMKSPQRDTVNSAESSRPADPI